MAVKLSGSKSGGCNCCFKFDIGLMLESGVSTSHSSGCLVSLQLPPKAARENITPTPICPEESPPVTKKWGYPYGHLEAPQFSGASAGRDSCPRSRPTHSVKEEL